MNVLFFFHSLSSFLSFCFKYLFNVSFRRHSVFPPFSVSLSQARRTFSICVRQHHANEAKGLEESSIFRSCGSSSRSKLDVLNSYQGKIREDCWSWQLCPLHYWHSFSLYSAHLVRLGVRSFCVPKISTSFLSTFSMPISLASLFSKVRKSFLSRLS